MENLAQATAAVARWAEARDLADRTGEAADRRRARAAWTRVARFADRPNPPSLLDGGPLLRAAAKEAGLL